MPKEVRVGLKIRDAFLEKGEAYAGEIATVIGIKYYTIGKLFYALRELGLIEFVSEKDSDKLINYRLHRIVPGKEDDPRWEQYPIAVLYPSCGKGAARYEKGTAKGRADEYAKKD